MGAPVYSDKCAKKDTLGNYYLICEQDNGHVGLVLGLLLSLATGFNYQLTLGSIQDSCYRKFLIIKRQEKRRRKKRTKKILLR